MGIPARDLTDFDIAQIASNLQSTSDEVIEMLCKTDLYNKSDAYICAECGKEYKSWTALNKHELKHIEEQQESMEDMDNDNSINRTEKDTS
jgi:DNA-directed RNA polymerase subunit RPC12/RpoP